MTASGACSIRGAHASRVVVAASRRNGLPCDGLPKHADVSEQRKLHEVRDGGTPPPTRGTRVLPGAAPRRVAR